MSWTRVFRRAGRRTNVALLLLFAAALLTGALVFAAGTPAPATLAVVAHGLVGLAMVALVPWKTVVVRRARARPRRRLPVAAVVLTVLVVACLAAGFIQFFVGYHVLAGLSPIQVHVGAALLAVPLLAWHVLRGRRQPLRRADLRRRALFRTAGFTVAAGAGYAVAVGLAGWTRGAAGRVSTGSGRLDPDAIPATIWLLDRVPELDPGTHRVDVAGRSLGTADLEARSREVVARLDCTSGWYAVASWSGVPLSELVTAERLAAATSIEVTSVTGYTRRFPVDEAGDLWLATRSQGRPLSAGTGSPVRLVAPHRRGFWWVKWVASVRLSDTPAWRQVPFPPQ